LAHCLKRTSHPDARQPSGGAALDLHRVAAAGVDCRLYNAVVEQVNLGSPLVSAQIGQVLFIGLTIAVQTLLVFLAPATSVNSISSEHERYTFDILMATPLAAVQILLAKLLVALAFVGLLLVCALPLFSMVVLFGGVELADLGRVLLTVAITNLLGCVLGLFCSVVTRQTYTATLLCYALLIAIIGGTLFAANIWSVTNAQASAPPEYVVANPLSATAAALASVQPPEVINIGTLRPVAILGLLTQGTVRVDGGAVTVVPVYRATWVLYGGLSLVLFWISLHTVEAVQMRRAWFVSRSDMVLAGLLVLYGVGVWLAREWWLAGL
ncbi:MAG: ABC transporter permease subunit, partial [Chloroflexaceae bacterium]|nr:ABC transporter permease subunit [Chloroflexaceae bacterium]